MIQTEMHQYNSRRERHDAEARQNIHVEYGPTRRETRAIERADEYLNKLSETTNQHVKNQELWPGAPILGLTDSEGNLLFEGEKPGTPVDISHDLAIHQGIIGAYQDRVKARDWNVIGELDEKWHEVQPSEEEVETKFESYEANDPSRIKKIGDFVSRCIFGARQHWLNQRTATAKQRMYYEYVQDDSQDYKKAA